MGMAIANPERAKHATSLQGGPGTRVPAGDPAGLLPQWRELLTWRTNGGGSLLHRKRNDPLHGEGAAAAPSVEGTAGDGLRGAASDSTQRGLLREVVGIFIFIICISPKGLHGWR